MSEEVTRYNSALTKAKAELPLIEAFVEVWRAYSRPATDDEILMELEKLQGRYHAFESDPALAKFHDEEWLEDLEGFSIGQLKAACKGWRMSDNAFGPRSAGQLVPFAGTSGEADVRYYGRIAEKARHGVPAVPMERLSDDERQKHVADIKGLLGNVTKPVYPPTAEELEAKRVKTLAELRVMASEESND